MGKRITAGRMIREAGDQRGYGFEARIRSYLDAGLHLGLSLDEAKQILVKHMWRNANAASIIKSAFICSLGVAIEHE